MVCQAADRYVSLNDRVHLVTSGLMDHFLIQKWSKRHLARKMPDCRFGIMVLSSVCMLTGFVQYLKLFNLTACIAKSFNCDRSP